MSNLENKMQRLIGSFANTYKMSKEEFLKNSFDNLFELIPEAEKGSMFELKGGFYSPIVSRGYDLKTINELHFKEDTAFLLHTGMKGEEIEVYTATIPSRIKDTRLPKETKGILEKLGTLNEFTTMYAPIRAGNNTIGMIAADRFDGGKFDPDSILVMKYYAHLISEFYNQILSREKLEKTYIEIVTALVTAIEIKDKYTQGHAKRVRDYSISIAEAMQLPKDEIAKIDLSALLHDIGKIGIPKEILNKESGLDNNEFSIIKEHTEYSRRIIQNISDFAEIARIIYSHHENFDGSGYPQGLKDYEIPLAAKIIQIADAYDAMTSTRSYREAMNFRKAIRIIRKQEGSQFNPEIAEIAIKEVFLKDHNKNPGTS